MMASLDEGYLKQVLPPHIETYRSITAYMSEHNLTASETVTQLRSQVEEKTALTISAGIAPNKMLAKVCIDRRARLTSDMLR